MAALNPETLSPKAAWIAKRRREARESGLCITCCKMRPQTGRSVCVGCTKLAGERIVKHRLAKKQRAIPKAVLAYEREGDDAQSHHLYTDATEYYRRVLKEDSLGSTDRLRVSEKLVQTLFNSADPQAANLQLDNLLIDMKSGTTKTAELLLQRARNYWIDCKTNASLPLIARAMEIARETKNLALQNSANIIQANVLSHLGRNEEAEHTMRAIALPKGNIAPSIRADISICVGHIVGALGKASETYAAFEEAARLADEDANAYLFTVAWGDCALRATGLGDLERAKSATERALLIARRNRILWRIPHLCLDYAMLLKRIGQYHTAREYVLEALSYDAHAPVLETAIAAVGIPISLYLHDRELLARCVRYEAIEFAFRSLEPARIGPIVAAFSQFYTTKGEQRKAEQLIHRAIGKMCYIDEGYEFLIETARNGSANDIAQARLLLQDRAQLPSSRVAEACLFLLNAFSDQRCGDAEGTARNAVKATKCFEDIRWYEFVELARGMLPHAQRIPKTPRSNARLISDMKPALTRREEEVVGLVLRGLTNREIATELTIREHTVEKHMSSIMNRMGIRSRHQLVGLLVHPEST